jgi:hypothetical protein
MRPALALEQMKSKLVPGKVYRRSSFTNMSTNVDRNLAKLVDNGDLKKISKGLYLVPKETTFGEALPDEQSLLENFLNDDHFVVFNPNQFNSLGLGTTQLYNETIVFNRKRVGEFSLGGRTYYFHRWRESPKKMTLEFLVVQMLNRLDSLAEDRNMILGNLKKKLYLYDVRKLLYNADHYGTIATQKLLKTLLEKLE